MPSKAWRDKQTPERKKRLSEAQRIYRKTDRGKMLGTINSWRGQGLISDNMELIYERYINSTHCECCRNEYKSTMDRHMDHCHVSGKFRNVLCRHCNQLRGHIEKDYKLILKLQTMC